MRKNVITLDGPAGSGKSTLAAMIAQKYPFYQIDSGALYRTFTYIAIKIEKSKELQNSVLNSETIEKYLKDIISANIKLSFDMIDSSGARQTILFNDQIIGDEIREPIINSNIKFIADNIEIRKRVNSIIRNIAEKYPVVADGRDMGSIVFPDADIKFFITASSEIRAKRRYNEMIEKKIEADYDEILSSIQKRDHQDENRTFGALKRPTNAIFIDTTTMNLKVAFEQVEKVITDKFKALK